MKALTRRLFLSHAPLVTSAALIPVIAIAAEKPLNLEQQLEAMTAKERANFHYAAFVDAMAELTRGFDGWNLYASETKAFDRWPAKSHRSISVMTFDTNDSYSPPGLVENHMSFDIGKSEKNWGVTGVTQDQANINKWRAGNCPKAVEVKPRTRKLGTMYRVPIPGYD